jgi:hypothetical protein
MGPKIHSKFHDKIENAIIKLLDAFDIQFGPCHIELKIHKNNLFLIEIASRAGGWRDKLMKYAGYSDYNKLILSSYLDSEHLINILQPSKNSLVNIMLYWGDGDCLEEARAKGVLKELFLYEEKGPTISPKTLIDAFGYAYFSDINSLKKFSIK